MFKWLSILLLSTSCLIAQTNFDLTPKSIWATNNFYNKGEQTIEITPTLFSRNIFDSNTKKTFGFSMEYEYWQTLCTGTGIELGCRDIKTQHGIDHISVMEDYRLVYLPDKFLWNKAALVAKSAAETDLSDGNKGIALGLGINYNLFMRKVRLEASLMQHLSTKPEKEGLTLRVGMQYVF